MSLSISVFITFPPILKATNFVILLLLLAHTKLYPRFLKSGKAMEYKNFP